ncbi:MAG: alginate O-acetyltransferase [Bacteroidetes bacterium RIFOXYA12_FULL_35_11]|nr:MAG: alginate O-acetyltransferase [Bacteroidetes bacterium GWF2_35_48]OFY72488.1 MAG: alginate O-acetyltransferase [Bacteroidetes bacterium RIFOXYA12_FULL_35_11]HBX51987.1 membrane-bound O-acyltransferase family protein [Bacteroidales bacterium]
MLFNSLQFAFFFPLVTLLYFALPHKLRWALLLGASCIFYMAFIPSYILILVATIIVDYIAGIYIEKEKGPKRRLYLIISIITNIGFLAFFKYFNFLNSNVAAIAHFLDWNYSIEALSIILPVGLSFHTFQAMSYTIEVYRGTQKAEYHFGIYALYVMFYPQLVAGPIERPQNLIHQFYEKHTFDYQRVTDGLKLMLWGFFKKMVIADRLSLYVNQVYNNPDQYSGFPVLLATYLFAFQIFCDFSGYSDIAIGSAKIMGFKLMDNFNTPYFAKTIKEFWKRWHISLSTWFRDYLYISLGGNRVIKWKMQFNLFIVFMISGLWHGANWTFVLWGSLHGFYIISAIWLKNIKVKINNFFNLDCSSKLIKVFDIFVTFHLVCLSWIFFRADTISNAFKIIKNTFSFNSNFWNLNIPITINELAYSLFFIFLMELIHFLQRKSSLIQVINQKSTAIRWLTYCIFIWLIFIFGEFGNQQFIYFQF